MIAVELEIQNQRMLALMDMCVRDKKVYTQKEFLESIDFNPVNIYQVQRGEQGFRFQHFKKAAEVYDVSLDWFAGLTLQMKRQPSSDPLQLIRDAVLAIEMEIRQKDKGSK